MLNEWRLLVAATLLCAILVEAEGDEAESDLEAPSPPLAHEGGQGCSGGGGEGAVGGDGGSAELTVESGLNATGHWLAKVRLQHEAGAAWEGPGARAPVQLQVRRWARRSGGGGGGGAGGGARLVTLQATLTGPSASSKGDLAKSEWTSPCPACSTESSKSFDRRPTTACPPPAPCPLCPAPPIPAACPSPCPAPCPAPAACPSCPVAPTPEPMECPSPCATPPPCPTCPSCPACPTARECPSPCATTPPCPACPSCTKPTPLGYERHAGHGAYRLHLMRLNWFEAQATCEREGAHLAIINSQAEADILAGILRSQSVNIDYVMMGFHDLYIEGSFYTVLDKPLDSSGYYKWRRGEPNNSGEEDCGGIYVDEMALNDHGCHRLKEPFICEIP